MKTIASRLFVCLALGVWAAGCATAQPTERKGLLEGASGESPVQHRRALAAARTPSSRATESPVAERKRFANPVPSGRPAVEVAASSMHWPLQQIQITSPFGRRGREFHEGIDLKAQQGTPVLAAQDGTVIYAGSKIRGYGKLIVIRHQRQISTIYAHNSQLLVRAGQYVHQGQRISITGQTGHVTGPHLHFEVRDGLAALNPMDFLPGLRVAADLAPAPVPSKPVRRIVAVQAPRKVVAVSSKSARPVSYTENDD